MIEKSFLISEIEFVKSDDDKDLKKGTFKGAMAAESLDRVGDIIAPEAFNKTIKDYKTRNRSIRMFYQHNMHDLPIGGVDPNSIKKEDKKWTVVGEIATDTALGADVYTLMKKGLLSDLSIHGIVRDSDYDKDGNRILKEIDLSEISVVSEPANPNATVDFVKSVSPARDLPLADRSRAWDSSAAVKRVRSHTKSDDSPSSSYKDAFLWYDESNKDNFTAYKLPFADVINGKLTAVPRAIFAALQAVRGARGGGVDIPADDKEKVISVIKKYYSKMNIDFPTGKCFIDSDDVESIKSRRDFELVLRDSGLFSKQAAIKLASYFFCSAEGRSDSEDDADNLNEDVSKKLDALLDNIKKLNEGT